MSEKRILLASLLKPINDTRMYEKFGLSLCKLEQVQLHIAGYIAPIPSGAPANLSFHPIFQFERLSLGRAKAQLLYWKLLQQVKPNLIIVCTHELLWLSVLYKKLNNCRVIYDIQENYTLNILSQEHYHPGVKNIVASGIKLTEHITAAAIDHFLLAEMSYAPELPFIDNRYTVIENKFKPATTYSTPATPVQITQENIKLLYTGTIATLYGVFDAVALTSRLHEINPRVSLTIIGYCASKETLVKLKEGIKGKPYIKLTGGDKLVPHHQIIEKIQASDIGLLPYHYNKSTFNCIPTKLYEYAALGLPIFIQQNPTWNNLINTYDAGLPVDFNYLEINQLYKALLNNKFYQYGIPETMFWESEERKLLPVIREYL